MMGVLESNIDQLPKIAFSAMLVHLASKKLKKFHVEDRGSNFGLARAIEASMQVRQEADKRPQVGQQP